MINSFYLLFLLIFDVYIAQDAETVLVYVIVRGHTHVIKYIAHSILRRPSEYTKVADIRWRKARL